MSNFNFAEITNILILAFSLFSIIFAFGIVWRVEKKLDLSFKFMLAAVIFYTLSKLADFIKISEKYSNFIILGFNFLFIISFFISLLELRSMLRKLDGEK